MKRSSVIVINYAVRPRLIRRVNVGKKLGKLFQMEWELFHYVEMRQFDVENRIVELVVSYFWVSYIYLRNICYNITRAYN